MIKHFIITAAALAAIGSVVPASAEEIGVGFGPGGVTVGAARGDRYRDRDREYARDRDYRERDETVVVRRPMDRDRDYDRDRGPVIINR